MYGVAVVVAIESVLVVVLFLLVAAWLIDTGPETPTRVGRSGPVAVPAARAAVLRVTVDTSWTLARAGLAGPSAWLTAPRETEDFAARRAAIAAAYDNAER
jgi:hypothetical protein